MLVTETNREGEREMEEIMKLSWYQRMLFVADIVYKGLVTGRPKIAFFLDLASGTVNHTLLLQKLNNYDIQEVTTDLLKMFLGNRVCTLYK